MANEKKTSDKLKEKLFFSNPSCYEKMTEADVKKAYDYCEGYKKFLDEGKTEREFVKASIEYLTKKGFKEFDFGAKVKAGEKYYYNNHNKNLAYYFS